MKIFSILFFVFISLYTFAQKEYKAMMDDNSINFYEVCEEADNYFESHDKTLKGSGWKGYQRWKNANEYKYYPSGDRENIDPYFSANSYLSFLKENDAIQQKDLFNNGWEELGPFRLDSLTGHYSAGLGRVEDHYVDPTNTNTMYLASRSGGFWRTSDGGITWQGGSTDFLIASGINTIAVSPTHSDSILINVRNAGNGNSHGIYRSTDGGESWLESNFNPVNTGFGGLGDNFKIYKIAYHPTVTDLIFIGTSKGIFRSADNLQTWTRLLNLGDVTDIAFHPNNDSIIYLSETYYWGSNINYVMRSLDMGLSYTQSNQVIGNDNNRSIHLSVSPDCSDCLYFASDNGVWKSMDNGMNFTFLTNPDEGCGGFVVNDLDTSSMIYGYVDIVASEDGGNNFEKVTYWSLGDPHHGTGSFQENLSNSSSYVHADLHPAKCINGVFYVGTDGLFCKSTDNGYSWEILSQGTAIRENYNLGVSQSNHFRSISGSQDNGTSIKHKDHWVEFFGADGMEGIIHPLNDDLMIGSYQFGGRIKTSNGGQTVFYVTPPNSEDGQWEAPLAYDPNEQMRIYDFRENVYVSDDFGVTWTNQGSPSGFSTSIHEAAIAENNSSIIVISSYENIDKSIDGGATFTSIQNNLPIADIQDIAFDPSNDEIIIVTYARYQDDGKKVYITYNGGDSWVNITSNLGDMPIRSVVIDHTDSSTIYLGAEIGVYSKSMNATDWTLYNADLPNTTIKELEIVYATNTIKAATWGRGLWEYSLVGRNSFPAILTTKITDLPSSNLPMVDVDQYITSVISYDDALTSVFVKYSIDATTFDNSITMTNTDDSTWVSENPLPNYPVDTKVFFKVFAIGSNSDTTETYKFMYSVKPYEACASSGTMVYQGNITLVDFNDIYNSTGKTQPYTNYSSSYSTTVIIDSSYDISVNLNTDNGNYLYYAKAWIDWNHDVIFSEEEAYELGSAQNVTDAATSFSPFSISIPSNATLGPTRMRVSCQYLNYPTPCDNGFDGEVEDYEIVVETLAMGIEENAVSNMIIYPNPSTGIVTIKGVNLDLAHLKLYNSLGQELNSQIKVIEKQKNIVIIDLSGLSTGMYYLKAGTLTKKVYKN